MKRIEYEVMELATGQQCFGAGHWVIVRTVTETILAAPNRGKAEEFARELREAAANG